MNELLRKFLEQDAARRSGGGSSIEDRKNEGALMNALGAPSPVIGAVGAGYEGAKAIGQALPEVGKYFPGPFEINETTSPASMQNVGALLKGALQQDLNTKTGGASNFLIDMFNGGE